jgi:hypothetical protein
MYWLLAGFLFAAFWGMCCAALAARHNRDAAMWGVLGLLFGPLALILLACLGDSTQSNSRKVRKRPRPMDYETRRILESEQDRYRRSEQGARTKEIVDALDAELEKDLGQPRGT